MVWNHGIVDSPIVGMMIQSDELIFFGGVGQPPTRPCFTGKSSIGHFVRLPEGKLKGSFD